MWLAKNLIGFFIWLGNSSGDWRWYYPLPLSPVWALLACGMNLTFHMASNERPGIWEGGNHPPQIFQRRNLALLPQEWLIWCKCVNWFVSGLNCGSWHVMWTCDCIHYLSWFLLGCRQWATRTGGCPTPPGSTCTPKTWTAAHPLCVCDFIFHLSHTSTTTARTVNIYVIAVRLAFLTALLYGFIEC